MIEQFLNKATLCSDGMIRKLNKIDEKYLYYSVAIGETEWMDLGRTYRCQAEDMFIKGQIIT